MATTRQNGEGSNSCSNNIRQPKFFKIIFSPHECTRLSIPKDFASKFCKNMQTLAYLEVPSGEVWEVEVVHSDGQIWLTKGWQNFSGYYSISCGHFLMFGYNGHSHFNVTIFDLSASEIEYPYSAARATHSTEPYDSIEILEDDVSIDVQNVDSPSFTRKGQKTSEGFRKHKPKSKFVHDKNKAAMDKERAIAYQRAKAFKSENPFIISFMQPSYVFTPFSLSISLKFARKYFLEDCGDLVLRVPGRGSWSVKCSIGKNAKMFWKSFVLHNKLKVGDVCVLEVIKGTKLIDVTIFQAAGSTPIHKIAGEVSGVSDGKNKLIGADNSIPCSQPEVVHTNKLKLLRGEGRGESTEDTGIECSVEILGHRPLGQGSKRKREEGEAEDDVSIDIHTKSIKLEKPQEDEASPSFTRKTKKSGESSRMHKQQSKITYGKNKTVMDKERTIAYQRAKAFKSKNPFFISFMQPSYISTPYVLSFRLTFAKTFLGENCNLMLRVPGRVSWSVKCSLQKSDAKFLNGWKAFVLDNKLNVGDVCVFEVIEGTQLVMDVTIFRGAGSTPVDKICREVPTLSASKNKIIKTENSDPFTPPNIVRSQKLNLEKKQKRYSYRLASKIKEELGECTGKHVQQSNPSCMGRVMAKDMVIAYQRAKAFTSENPFFICFMQPSYVSPARFTMRLSITLSLARKFFPTKHSDLVLQVPSKRSWAVKCTVGTVNAKLCTGWKEFVQDNNLKVGDVCVFELVSRSKLLFNVIIFSAAEGV